MDVVELEALKDRVNERYIQSPGGDLDGMLDDMKASLSRSNMVADLRLRKTGSRHHLVEAHCRRASPLISVAQLQAELARIWEEELRYDDFAAHAFDITNSTVVLDFLTVARSAKLYMTGMIIVDL
jgi:hypothetical protein